MSQRDSSPLWGGSKADGPEQDSSASQTPEAATPGAAAAVSPSRFSRRLFLRNTVAASLSVATLAATDAQAHPVRHMPQNDLADLDADGPFRRGPVSDTYGLTIDEAHPASLLDEAGHFLGHIPVAQYEAWKKDARKKTRELTDPRRAALLHLWLGEYELGVNEEPVKAGWHFRKASLLTRQDDPWHGWAQYNAAMALFLDSRYRQAAEAFAALTAGHLKGFERQSATLWSRHAAAHAAEHQKLGDMGIPRPPSLDTICGAGGMALILRNLKMPYDKKMVLSRVRHTGRGSNLQDLVDASEKFGLTGRALVAGEEAFKALPKPLVAYVERDHFVGVMETSDSGVVYSCTDCGSWPGGRVQVTWEQWRAMKPGIYLVAVKPGSPDDLLIDAVLTGKALNDLMPKVAFRGDGPPASGLLSQLLQTSQTLQKAYAQLTMGGLALVSYPGFTECGYGPVGLQCPPNACCPMAHGGPAAGASGGGSGGGPAGPPVPIPIITGGGGDMTFFGSSAGDPVNLATLEEEYTPAPDLTVYNPTGPAVVWQRLYNSLRGQSRYAQNADMGQGWSHNYNINVYDPSPTQGTAATAILGLVPPGFSGKVAVTGTLAPTTSGATWEIRKAGVAIAYYKPAGGSLLNGWSVSYDSANNQLNITAPSTAVQASDYEARYIYSGSNKSGPFTVGFSNRVPQAGTGQVNKTGALAPSGTLSWEIYKNNVVVADSSNRKGWNASWDGTSQYLSVSAPLTAIIATDYAVRVLATTGPLNLNGGQSAGQISGDGGTNDAGGVGTNGTGGGGGTGAPASGPFSVIAHAFIPQAGTTKYIVFPNGGKISFVNPSLPNAGTPVVVCNVPTGIGLRVEMMYDANNPASYYVITFADGTKWTTAGLLGLGYSTAGSSYLSAFYYPIGKMQDRVGNAIKFVYGNPVSNSTPNYNKNIALLSQITDGADSPLLTLNRGSGTRLSSVSDCYNRSVSYTVSSLSVNGTLVSSIDGLTSVSQIGQTGGAVPANRYTYGYISVPNGGFNGGSPETTQLLGSITVPSPTGVGNSVSYIQYSQGETGTNVPKACVRKLIDANGNVTEFSQVNADGSNYTGSTGSSYTKATIKDSGGNLVYSYWVGFDSNMSETIRTDGAGNVISTKIYGSPTNPYGPDQIKDGMNRTWQRSFDQYGNISSETTPRGITTTKTFVYSPWVFGRLTQVAVGTKTPTVFAYNEPSGLAQYFDYPRSGAAGGVARRSFTWDALGNVLTEVMPGNNAVASKTTTNNYTTDGAYTQTAKVNQPLVVTDNLGHATHFRYDTAITPVSRGLVTQSWDALGNQVDITYNLADQVVTVQLPATGQTGSGRSYQQNVYQYVGGPLTATKFYDESGALVRQVNYAYGSEGESLSVTGSTEPVAYSYDAIYRVKTLKDGNNNQTSYAYNTAGYLSSMTYPGTDAVQYTSYNNAGQLLSMTDGRGIVRNLAYSTLDGVLTDIQYPAYPAQNVHYDYDSYGRATGKTDGQGGQTYSYDDRDALIQTITTYTGVPAQTITRDYWPDGSVKQIGTPAGNFTFNYDGAGRAVSQTNPYNETTGYSYLDNDWLSGQTLANGLSASFTYNALGQLTQLKNQVGSTVISQFGNVPQSPITYDGVGNRLSVAATVASMTSLSGVTTYGYDNKNQLTSEVSARAGGYNNAFGYDSAGNPTSFKGQARTFNGNNQRTGTGFAYDNNGNPTTYNGQSATYDVNNCLTGLGSGFTAGYTAEGVRAWKQGTTTKTYFLYDSGVPVIELNATGAVAAVNTFGVNGLVSRWRSATNSIFYAFDERGVTTQRLDASGTIYTSRMADAVGVPGGTAATTDPYDGFGGQWGYYRDAETNLTLCTHRYYDSAQGRWLTRDPINYSDGMNVYCYTGNSPVGNIDSLGLASMIVVPTQPKDQWGRPYHHQYISVNCKGLGKNFGFYPNGPMPNLFTSVPGKIYTDDPAAHKQFPRPAFPSDVNNDPAFEKALCDCIRDTINGYLKGGGKRHGGYISGGAVPNYTLPGYVCKDWANDQWNCAARATGSWWAGW